MTCGETYGHGVVAARTGFYIAPRVRVQAMSRFGL